MKISTSLAHEIQNELQKALGYLELGRSAATKDVILRIAKLVKEQTVVTFDKCEACGHTFDTRHSNPETRKK
jgi:hypothetical protein